jgi:TolA-binding protein
MKWIGSILAIFLLVSGCTQAQPASAPTVAPLDLWRSAHDALAAQQFGRADTLFARLVRDYGASETGRESLFYLGAIRLDPRNPSWNSDLAEAALHQYLAMDTVGVALIHRRPEAGTLYELARQLNMPGEDRVPGLQPETKVVTRVVPQRVVVPAKQVSTLQAEIDRLRDQVATRDAKIKQQEDELDRIRKTLAAPGSGR